MKYFEKNLGTLQVHIHFVMSGYECKYFKFVMGTCISRNTLYIGLMLKCQLKYIHTITSLG